MAYSKKTWVDRQVEHPGRRRLTATGTSDVYDVTREEGLVMEDGDALNAATFNNLETRIASAFEDAASREVFSLTHSKSGTVHYLTGLSGVSGTVSCVFKATSSYSAGDSIRVDGTSYTIQLSNGEAAEDNLFVSGASVPVVIDTGAKKVNFRSGGGLTNAKLALATATEADVADGKTFYAGDKTLKTGTGYKQETGTVATVYNRYVNVYPSEISSITFAYIYTTGSDAPLSGGAFAMSTAVDGYGVRATSLGPSDVPQFDMMIVSNDHLSIRYEYDSDAPTVQYVIFGH